MNHTESQFVFQMGDDLEIRLCEPNGCGFELVFPRHCLLLQHLSIVCRCLRAMRGISRRQPIGIAAVSPVEEFLLIVTASGRHDVEKFTPKGRTSPIWSKLPKRSFSESAPEARQPRSRTALPPKNLRKPTTSQPPPTSAGTPSTSLLPRHPIPLPTHERCDFRYDLDGNTASKH
jgi:hypothetical protein